MYGADCPRSTAGRRPPHQEPMKAEGSYESLISDCHACSTLFFSRRPAQRFIPRVHLNLDRKAFCKMQSQTTCSISQMLLFDCRKLWQLPKFSICSLHHHHHHHHHHPWGSHPWGSLKLAHTPCGMLTLPACSDTPGSSPQAEGVRYSSSAYTSYSLNSSSPP